MWLFTTSGFYSIVEKPWDRGTGTLTVRARVAQDLDRLRAGPLPALGPTTEDAEADYRFRAQAPREAVALAAAGLIRGIGYDNFKSEVGMRQGHQRSDIYLGVWTAARKLQKGS